MVKRSPILGYNHNMRHRGLVFHVQTEDSGVDNPHIFTHIFQGGVILSTRKLEYDGESAEDVVKALMQAQHKAVLKDLKKGTFDDKITQYFGDRDDLEPPASAPQAVEEGDTIRSAIAGDSAPTAEESASAVAEAVTGEDDTTLPFEAAASEDDVGAAVDAVREETDPAGVRVTWRDITPRPEEQPLATPSPAPAPSAESPRASAPRVPRPDEPSDVYSRRGSREVVGAADEMEQALEGSRSGAASAPDEGEAPRQSRPPRRHRNSNRSGVVVSRPSVIVGSSGRGQERGRAPPRRSADAAASERPAKERARRAHEDRPREGIFGQDLISEKSLDEVILAYLSEDSSDE